MNIKKNAKPERVYACCPNCAKPLLQAKGIESAIIRCEKCHKKVLIDIINGKAITESYKEE